MFWNNFVLLCNSKNKTPTSVISELNISRGSVTHWKSGKVPHHNTLIKIADYFNVPVDYLLRKPQKPTITEIAKFKEGNYEADLQKANAQNKAEKSNLIPLSQNNVYSVPVVENVSAGFGTFAINDIVDYIPLYFTSEYEAQETICIKVKGDSMFPKIEDGDIIQVHKQTSVDSGSIAVVLLDEEEGLVKKVVYGPDWIELHSINPMYPVQRFEDRNVLRLRVVGLVKKIIKSV